jgi:hypothetical protein
LYAQLVGFFFFGFFFWQSKLSSYRKVFLALAAQDSQLTFLSHFAFAFAQDTHAIRTTIVFLQGEMCASPVTSTRNRVWKKPIE